MLRCCFEGAPHPWCDDRGVSIASVAGENWAGSHVFAAPALLEATTVAEVQDAVAAAATSGGRIRALGTRHSFTDLADTTGTLVTVTSIDPDPVLDVTARTVTVGGGIRYGVLAAWLEEQGRALHNMGSLPHISVAGAVATGTHGSGVGNRVLSGAVAALEYVDHRGELVTVRRGDPDFEGLVVGLGAFGVVVRVTLDIEPSYRMRQDVYRDLPWRRCSMTSRPCWGSGTASASSTTGRVRLSTRCGSSHVSIVSRASYRISGSARAGPAVRGPLIDLASENLTVQGGVEGAWLDRLPHFRLESTPSIGAELQTEYFSNVPTGRPRSRP